MRVVVVGGGYGGTAVAQELDAAHEVVLVEPKDAFVHASATLRAVVDPTWQDRVFYPYDQLLTRGRVVRDWARLVSPGRVRFSATEEVTADRSEEHTSELQSRGHIVCRPLLGT